MAKRNFWQWLRRKYRIVILNDTTFAEHFSIRSSSFGISLLAASIVVSLSASIVAVFYKTNGTINSKMEITPLVEALVLIAGALVSILVTLRYLNTPKKTDSKFRELEREIKYTIHNIQEATRQSRSGNNIPLHKLISTEIKNTIENDLLRKLEERFSLQSSERLQLEILRDTLNSSSDRLSAEVLATTRRANLSLAIGITSTIGAVLGFIYIIFWSPLPLTSDLFTFFLPRIVLIVFVQVFAYFFLRLYKRGIEDIKYYQNELTNVESKVSGVEYVLSLKEDKKELHQIIVSQLLNSERNAILKKGQSTQTVQMVEIPEKQTPLHRSK